MCAPVLVASRLAATGSLCTPPERFTVGMKKPNTRSRVRQPARSVAKRLHSELQRDVVSPAARERPGARARSRPVADFDQFHQPSL